MLSDTVVKKMMEINVYAYYSGTIYTYLLKLMFYCFKFAKQRKKESTFKSMLKSASPPLKSTDTWEEVCPHTCASFLYKNNTSH